MNEQRIKAYINLIQELLNCPSEEAEAQLLQQHRQLIDEAFVQVCQLLAQQYIDAGRENAADFFLSQVQRWVSSTTSQPNRRGAMLAPETDPNTTPEDYLNFFFQLLQVEINSDSDPKVVYPFLAQHTDRLNLTFAAVVQQWFHSQLDPDNSEINQALAALFNSLANKLQQFPLGSRLNNLEIAIIFYQLALEVRTREAYPEDWAMTQNNLGNAYRNRIKGERADNLEKAIAAYNLALEVRTRQAYPEQWAETQNNLAAAYSDRIKGERADNLEKAIAAYNLALEVRTREAYPQDHVATLFNLGLAYRDAAQLENASESFAAAIDTVEEIRSNIILGGEADRQKLAAEWNKLYVNMVEVCLELKNYAAALEYAERGKARNLVELLAATRLKPEGVTPEVWQQYNALYQQWWNLQQQQNSVGMDSRLRGNDSGDVDSRSRGHDSTVPTDISLTDIAQNLTELRQQIDDLIAKEITPHDRKFRFGQRVEPIPYQEIQALVDKQTAIVEWYFTSEAIQAFIVTHQGEQPILVSTASHGVKALEQLKDKYLDDYLTDDYQWRQQLPSYLQRLAEILELDRLLSKIPDYCQQLILIPYRFLHLFPLHALPIKSPEKGGEKVAYLSDKFAQGIRYAPSSQILQISLFEAADGATDVAADVATDGPTDVATDVATDGPTDLATDGPTDVAADVATDGPTDVATDGPTDVATDGPTDVATDVATDLAADVAADVAADLGSKPPFSRGLGGSTSPTRQRTTGDLYLPFKTPREI